MKTKEQILKYLRAQPWYRTFINCCIDNFKNHYSYSGIRSLKYLYPDCIISSAFSWFRYRDLGVNWEEVNRNYLEWYNDEN